MSTTLTTLDRKIGNMKGYGCRIDQDQWGITITTDEVNIPVEATSNALLAIITSGAIGGVYIADIYLNGYDQPATTTGVEVVTLTSSIGILENGTRCLVLPTTVTTMA